MKIDSKLKRFIVLLDKAPFILFLEGRDYISVSVNPLLRSLGFLNEDAAVAIAPIEIKENTNLRVVISDTNKLPDPLAYNIIEALAAALPSYPYFDIEEFISPKWQKDIAWQNVDHKPEPAIHEYTITVDRITHELNTIYSRDLESSTKAYDGAINLSSVDISTPFPKALLKECAADIYEIIKIMSMNREPATIAKSKYMSVMHSGNIVFNWVNLKKIEEDLIAVLRSNNIKIEE